MKLHEAFGMMMPRVPTPSNEWPIPDCMVGLEFEYENPANLNWQGHWWNRKMPHIAEYWTTHEDGSLRDNGVEFVLRDPLMGKDLTDAIAALLIPVPPLTTSYRTSVHVHIDARDMELEELKTFTLLYALTEQGFFNYVGENRTTNNYCVPWYEAPEYMDGVAKGLFREKMDAGILARAMHQAQRYAALNVNSLKKYGSFEFRHFGSVVTHGRIRKWVSICMQLKLAARMIPYDQAEALVYEPAEAVYRAVFGPYAMSCLNGLTAEQHENCQFSASLLMSRLAAEDAMAHFEEYVPTSKKPSSGWEKANKALKEVR